MVLGILGRCADRLPCVQPKGRPRKPLCLSAHWRDRRRYAAGRAAPRTGYARCAEHAVRAVPAHAESCFHAGKPACAARRRTAARLLSRLVRQALFRNPACILRAGLAAKKTGKRAAGPARTRHRYSSARHRAAASLERGCGHGSAAVRSAAGCFSRRRLARALDAAAHMLYCAAILLAVR